MRQLLRLRRRDLAALLLATTAIAACALTTSGATPIQVALHEDAIDLDNDTVSSGPISLEIRNEGALVHEVEVFADATSGQILPVSNSVADTTGLILVDEVENILPDSRASLVLDLSPGTYLVICNLPLHYETGMSTFLTVEDPAG